uniref:Uncharacterized protein n=1 Tax=Cryphonectria parasitica TaxID=5116 RepID=P87089_CRYPA|nr:unknown [Cryphonectria parasitica]
MASSQYFEPSGTTSCTPASSVPTATFCAARGLCPIPSGSPSAAT